MSNLSINSCLRKYFYCFFNGTADSIWDRTAAASLASLSLKAQLIKRFGQMSSWAGEGWYLAVRRVLMFVCCKRINIWKSAAGSLPVSNQGVKYFWSVFVGLITDKTFARWRGGDFKQFNKIWWRESNAAWRVSCPPSPGNAKLWELTHQPSGTSGLNITSFSGALDALVSFRPLITFVCFWVWQLTTTVSFLRPCTSPVLTLPVCPFLAATTSC